MRVAWKRGSSSAPPRAPSSLFRRRAARRLGRPETQSGPRSQYTISFGPRPARCRRSLAAPARIAQEREAARQVKPYESDLVESIAARYGCVASGEERSAPERSERSDEEMWHATVDSLSSLKKSCLEYGFSAGGSKESLAARVYHPDQPDPMPAKRRRTAEILDRRRESSVK